jgi:hypothetical protein
MEMVAMMFGYAGDRAWWQAGLVPVTMTAFWGPPIPAVYSVITGLTRRPGPSNRDREHRGGGARRILGGPLAHGETSTGAYRRLGDELSPATTAVAVGTVTA